MAVDELNKDASGGDKVDANSEIDDDWLNFFSRVAEEKSSEELKNLFGRILAGEIRNPGAFSLRTIQFLSTLSKADAEQISHFFSFVLGQRLVPLSESDDELPVLRFDTRILMEELGLASQPSVLGGLSYKMKVAASSNMLLSGTGLGILISNQSDKEVSFEMSVQVLTKTAQELLGIANPSQTNFAYLKAISQILFEKIRALSPSHAQDLVTNKTIQIVVGNIFPNGVPGQFRVQAFYTASTTT